MALLAAIEVFDMLEAENGDGPYLPTGRGMTNHYHTFYISVKCHFSTTSPLFDLKKNYISLVYSILALTTDAICIISIV